MTKNGHDLALLIMALLILKGVVVNDNVHMFIIMIIISK